MTGFATLTRLGDDRASLRFERLLSHPPAKVWHALTDHVELGHWFPARIEGELRPGAPLRFVFPQGEAEVTSGEVLEVDEPRTLAFRWDGDELRFELSATSAGCRLMFTHTVNGRAVGGGLTAVARTSAGWDVCLALLGGRLDAQQAQSRLDWFTRNEAYVERFGLGEGTVHETGDGWVLRFERDLVQPVEQVWARLTTDGQGRVDVPVVGGEAPLRTTHRYVDAGRVTEVVPGRSLAYEWRHGDRVAGTVRWDLRAQAFGSLLSVEQSVPRELEELRALALAAWQTRLEALVANLHGAERCWPQGRTEALQQVYADRLG